MAKICFFACDWGRRCDVFISYNVADLALITKLEYGTRLFPISRQWLIRLAYDLTICVCTRVAKTNRDKFCSQPHGHFFCNRRNHVCSVLWCNSPLKLTHRQNVANERLMVKHIRMYLYISASRYNLCLLIDFTLQYSFISTTLLRWKSLLRLFEKLTPTSFNLLFWILRNSKAELRL